MSSYKEKIYSEKNYIIERYKQCLSAYEISKELNNKFNIKSSYRWVLGILKENDVFESFSQEMSKKRQEKAKNTMIVRYGVENISQFRPNKTILANKFEKTKTFLSSDFENYSKRVMNLSKKNKKKLINSEYCYYTGIKFLDENVMNVNPNDPLKKTIDHKYSVFYGFINGVDIEEISTPSNLVYCLRYCNSIKGNISVGEFLPYATKIREILINEGFESN